MYTIIETPEFQARSAKLWKYDERMEFFSYIAENPEAGDVISGGGGLRKVRWQREGIGKRGGVRVIYFNLLDDGQMLMLDIYAKNVKENINPKELKKLKGERDE